MNARIEADLLLTNAHFVTLDAPASALAVLNGRIVATEPVPARRTIDLGGAVVVPGFHDAHNHLAWFGLTLGEVDLRVTSLADLYARLGSAAATTPAEEWIVGSGYDENKCGGHPDRDGIERVAPGRKVWLKHTSGHLCVVSSAVLTELGIDRRPVEVDGGRVVAEGGRPTGLLEEQAQQLVAPLVLPYPLPSLVEAIDRAGRQYLREGITSCVEAGIGGGWIGKSPVELEAYARARDRGLLHVRVELMPAMDALHHVAGLHTDGEPGLGLDLGLRTGFGDDWLRIGPVKVFSDGSLIGHTAAMCHDFADTPGVRGYLQAEADALTDRIVAAHRAGWRVATHAIGDAAIDVVLDAFERAQREQPRTDVRHRVEHFGVARPDQVTRAAALGVVPVPQGRFVHEIGDGMLRALGPDRTSWAYRARSLLDAGLPLPGSSDRPVVAGAPLLGMQALVRRRTAGGRPFAPEEEITGQEALHAFTLGSAYASHAEHRLGSLSVGKLADLVVLSEDPTTCDPDRIESIEVLRTMVDGEFRWTA